MAKLEQRIYPRMDILGQCWELIAEEAKAEMRIKYGIEQAIYHLRSAVNNRVAFLLDTFSLRRTNWSGTNLNSRRLARRVKYTDVFHKEKYLVCVR